MIRNVFDRPMFQNPNIRRSIPGGIMASSPELIRVGTAEASQIKPNVADEFKVGELKSGITQIPFYGNRKPTSKTSTQQIDFSPNENIKEISQNPFFYRDYGVDEDFGETKETAPKDIADPVAIDSAIPKNINETNEKILKEAKKKDNTTDTKEDTTDSFDIKELEDETAPDTKPSDSKFNFGDIKQRTQTEIQGIQNLYQTYATDLTNLKNANILGKTMDKHREGFLDALGKRPEEATFEDVRDSAFDMLGFDKETLDENLTKDQQGSIWLNMMRAGLAMAAGESPNAITNVAKGFQVGLEGYGKDMKDLTEDYREDVDRYQQTMYRLLKDKKSENIAKNALDVQRKAAEFNIVQQTRGEERKDLLDKLNTEVTMRKLKIESMATMANYDLEKFKLDKSDSEFQEMLEIHKAKIAGLLPDEINAAIAQGLVQVKDDSKLITADNLELTTKGINQQFDLVKSLKDGKNKYSVTDKKTTRLIAGGLPGYGLSVTEGTEVTDSMKNDIGEIMMGFDDTYVKILDGGDTKGAFDSLISGFNRLSKYGNKIKIDFQQLDNRIKDAYNEPGSDNKLRDQIDKLVDKGIVINILE